MNLPETKLPAAAANPPSIADQDRKLTAEETLEADRAIAVAGNDPQSVDRAPDGLSKEDHTKLLEQEKHAGGTTFRTR